MKIAFVLDDTLDTADGVQQYVITLGKWLTNNDHEVHYLVGHTVRKDIANIHSLTKNVKVRFNRNRMSIPLPVQLKKIKTLLKNEKYDLLHIQMPYSPQMAARIITAAPPATAIVTTFHILPYGRLEKIGTKLLARAVKKSTQRIDSVISVSAPAAEFAYESYGLKSNIIPNPVSVPTTTPKKNLETKNIVFLGRLVKRKGVINFVDALACLQKRYSSDWTATIIGKGPLEDKVITRLHEYGLETKVKMAGFVSEKEKYSFLAQADIAVFPSIGGESFGIVLIEAIAGGATVVIGGNNPGYSSVLKDKRVLFDPNDTDRLAKMMHRYLDDENIISELHDQQKDLIELYDVNKVAPEVVCIYKESIAKHKLNKDNV